MPVARTMLVTALAATGVALTAAFAFGPLDPPAGPVASTGVTLSQINSTIAGLGGSGDQRRSPIVPLEQMELDGFIEITDVNGPVGDPFPDFSTRITGYVDLALETRFGAPVVLEEVRVAVERGKASDRLLGGVISGNLVIPTVKFSVFSPVVAEDAPLRWTLELTNARVIEGQQSSGVGTAEFVLVAQRYEWVSYERENDGTTSPLPPVVFVR